MWHEGIEMAKTAYAFDEALKSGDMERIIELGSLLSEQVKQEVSAQAEAEGWYEAYDRATSPVRTAWRVETDVDPYGPAAFPVRLVADNGLTVDAALIEKGIAQGFIYAVSKQIEDDGSPLVTAAIGDHYLMVPELSTGAIMDDLVKMSGSDEAYFAEKLSTIAAYLQDNVDRPDEGRWYHVATGRDEPRPLQRLRRQAGFRSAADFAKAAGIPAKTYAGYERGSGFASVPFEDAMKIADILDRADVPVTWVRVDDKKPGVSLKEEAHAMRDSADALSDNSLGQSKPAQHR